MKNILFMQTDLSQPSIEIFGTTIMEPVVTLTDLTITAVCVYAFIQLKKLDKPGKVHRYIRWYFGIMAIATLMGGVLGHAFQNQISLGWKLPGWLISMLAIMAIERVSIMHAKPILNKKLGKIISIANIVEIIIFAVLAFTTLNFFFVQIHSAYGLGLVVLPIHFYVYWKTRNEGSRIFFLSVLFATLAAVFYTSKIGLHKWFNHLDLAHIVMAISLYSLYRGARKLNVMKSDDVKAKSGKFMHVFKTALKKVG